MFKLHISLIFVVNIKFLGLARIERSKLTGKIKGMKIGILKEGFGLPFSEPDVDAIVKDAAGKLASVGGTTVEEISILMHSDGRHILAAIFQLGGNRMLCQGAGENRCCSNKILFALEEGERSPNLVLGVLCYTGFGTSARMYHDTTLQEAFYRGLRTHSNDLPATFSILSLTGEGTGEYLHQDYNSIFYGKAQNLGRELCKAYDEELEKYDVLILPTILTKAPELPKENAPFNDTVQWVFR